MQSQESKLKELDLPHPEKRRKKKRPERTFSQKWKDEYEWLMFDNVNGVMKCAICLEFYKDKDVSARGQNTFVTGSNNLRKSTIQDHENTNSHFVAKETLKAAKATPREVAQTEAGKSLRKIKSAKAAALPYLVRNAHAVAKQNRPLTDYVWLVKLDKTKGLEVGKTYHNKKACLDFIEAIADTTRDSINDLLRKAPFFSFVMDGSTDIAGDEQESMFVRTTYQDKVYIKFLAIGSPESTCSSDLYEHVLQTFRDTKIDGFVAEGKI